MASITFVDKVTAIATAWLNEVNSIVHTIFGGASTKAAARVALFPTPTDGNILVGDGTDWINESGATARASLGVPSTTEVILDAIIDAKGDLISSTAADTPAILAVGSNGLFLETASSESTGLRWGNPSKPCEGRLTLTTAVPVATSDVTAATTVYFTPYIGDKIALYDGTNWRVYTFTELSIAVPASTSQMYDIFVYDNSGTLTLDATAWTNDTTRATAITRQNGVYVKSGSTSRRYLGSFRTTEVSGQTEDSLAKRYVYNYYNRIAKPMKASETTDTWNYSTASFRQSNASAANQLDFILGVSEDLVEATAISVCLSSTATARVVQIGIGLDSTTTSSATTSTFVGVDNNKHDDLIASYVAFPGIGRHFLAWLEKGNGTDTQTWHGDGAFTGAASGIIGKLFC